MVSVALHSLAAEDTLGDVARTYHLKPDDVKAALAYAAELARQYAGPSDIPGTDQGTPPKFDTKRSVKPSIWEPRLGGQTKSDTRPHRLAIRMVLAVAFLLCYGVLMVLPLLTYDRTLKDIGLFANVAWWITLTIFAARESKRWKEEAVYWFEEHRQAQIGLAAAGGAM
jgi:TPR repeat protein